MCTYEKTGKMTHLKNFHFFLTSFLLILSFTFHSFFALSTLRIYFIFLTPIRKIVPLTPLRLVPYKLMSKLSTIKMVYTTAGLRVVICNICKKFYHQVRELVI